MNKYSSYASFPDSESIRRAPLVLSGPGAGNNKMGCSKLPRIIKRESGDVKNSFSRCDWSPTKSGCRAALPDLKSAPCFFLSCRLVLRIKLNKSKQVSKVRRSLRVALRPLFCDARFGEYFESAPLPKRDNLLYSMPRKISKTQIDRLGDHL